MVCIPLEQYLIYGGTEIAKRV